MNLLRRKVKITGAVQGVGFRPFVYRLALELNLKGTVANTAAGVFIDVEGSSSDIVSFTRRVQEEAPSVSMIEKVESVDISDPAGFTEFTIIRSEHSGDRTVTILPDLATCPKCLEDIRDPQNRRYRYSFTNCTYCGPRFSIIRDLPYDRPFTEMHEFQMCPECRKEYESPLDRRFHAQPNACPKCGPHLSDETGTELSDNAILRATRRKLADGAIIALKSIGGFQLLCNAASHEAVLELRRRKQREEKPFAVMVSDLETCRRICHVSREEADLLTSSAAPITLLKTRTDPEIIISDLVNPDNPNLGVMLPYTPLHSILFDDPEEICPKVLVCTSGNMHDEPIAIDNQEAKARLRHIADGFVFHNRGITRQVDDSVVRHTLCGTQYLRRSRGYAPFPILHGKMSPPILSVGAHLKNTIALTADGRTIISQHIGDLSNTEAFSAFERAAADLPRLYQLAPEATACDVHPEYTSSGFAHKLGLPVIEVQHHHAHIAAVMAEHRISEPVFGISWDGTGLGDDQTIWGGEFLICENDTYQRVGYLKPFPLPGGDKAVKEPRRSALGLLHILEKDFKFSHGYNSDELKVVRQMLDRCINTPVTSSIGRLFDGVSALLNIRQVTRFEGQSAMMLEFQSADTRDRYSIDSDGPVWDWRPMLECILSDIRNQLPVSVISGKFHNSLIHLMTAAAQSSGLKKVVLGGGVFQNRILLEQGTVALEKAGFKVYHPIAVPVNDGGIALGQAWIAAQRIGNG